MPLVGRICACNIPITDHLHELRKDLMMDNEKPTLRARVSRGQEQGVWLFPHKFRDGMYVVSKSRFKTDYIRVPNQREAKLYIDKGYSLRMSNPDSAKHKSPSLIRPERIELIEE